MKNGQPPHKTTIEARTNKTNLSPINENDKFNQL
jgi:hypothetical protein